jgi:hypothetical protein
MKRYYNQGIASKGRHGHEDGDSLLWAALLLAAGESSQADAIRACQDIFGQMYRAPSRVGTADKNSFSRDMATGFTLAAASDDRIREHTYANWIAYTLENGCEACKEHDGRCLMTPGIYWWAHYLGIHVPFYYRWTAFLNRLYLLIAAFTTPTGYQLHLTGVSLFIQKKLGQWGWLEKKAAARLANRQPSNPFFAWLAGRLPQSSYLLEEAKFIINQEGQGAMHQWAWERDDKEEAFRDSCGHDIMFIEMLLRGKESK